jgi:hypothetical protein
MAQVKVYLFDYFDRLLKRDRRSTDYATADAIAAKSGTIIAESERMVDDELLDEDGTIRPGKLPPREVAAERPRWNDPNDVGVGPG